MDDRSLQIVVKLKDLASKHLAGIRGQVEGLGGAVKKSWGQATQAAKYLAAGAVVVGGGLVAASKAAFDQVKAVENASFALRAYEKDGGKVNKILSELVAYARSDMGVLFQRDELFKAASNLRGFGESADLVTDRVKILSKGVALGMTNFDELSQIVGRAAQQGKLTAEAYDQLAYRGIILDSSLRGASISADDLYAALDKALPDSVLAGRAQSIEGRMIRLQSAFRDLGSAILGVDKETSTFIKGGLGDRFLGAVELATQKLRDMEPAFRHMASVGMDAVDRIIGAFTAGGWAAAFTQAQSEIAKLDIDGGLRAAFARVNLVEHATRLIMGLLNALASFPWENYTHALTEGLFRFLMAVPWSDVAAKAIELIITITPDIISGFITGLINAAVNNPLNFVEFFLAIGFMPTKVYSAFTQVLSRIPLIGPIASWVMNGFKSAADWVLGPIKSWFSGLGSKAVVSIGNGIAVQAFLIRQRLSWAMEDGLSAARGFLAPYLTQGVRLVQHIAHGISSGAPSVSSAASSAASRAAQAVSGWASSAYSAGRNLIAGFANGIRDYAGNAVQAAKDAAGSAIQAVKNALGIRSPSRVFAEIGKYSMEGLAQGVNRNTGMAASAGAYAARSLVGGFGSPGMTARPSAPGGGVSPTQSAIPTPARSGPVFHNTYNVYNQVDLQAANFELGWRVANAG